jgi:hypothetical protein
MMIHADDLCRCGEEACGHTIFVFYEGSNKDWAPIEEIWANNNRGLRRGNCKKFIPKDNLKYLEMKYEEAHK